MKVLLQEYAPVVKKTVQDLSASAADTAKTTADVAPKYAAAAYDQAKQQAQVAAEKAAEVAGPMKDTAYEYSKAAANKAAVRSLPCFCLLSLPNEKNCVA